LAILEVAILELAIGKSSLDLPNGLKQLLCELGGARALAPVHFVNLNLI
jgi:hypothetical protein